MKLMTRKKVLITIDWFLPGTNSGGPVRSYENLLDHFSKDHDFYVITRNTDYCDNKPYETVLSDSWNTVKKNLNVYYISNDKLRFNTIKKICLSIKFDIVLINGVYSWYFSILPLWIFKFLKAKKIVSPRGMLNSQAFSTNKIKKVIFLKIARLINLYGNVFFHATNEDEASNIKILLKKNNIIIAPNLPRINNNKVLTKISKKSGHVKLIYTARISKEKGTLFAIRCLNMLILSSDTKIEFDLFGAIYDNDYWLECQNQIKKLPSNIIVKYKGLADSEMIPTILEHYHFLLLPSEGENFGHSILESFTAGRPALISNNTPWKNLELKKVGWDVSLENIDDLRLAITKTVEIDQNKYDILSKNAFDFATNFCNNKKFISQNERLFD